MKEYLSLLIALFACHYLADYCFTWPRMIQAKTNGKNSGPILLHSCIHAGLMGICLLLCGIKWKRLLMLMLIELVTHFIIDTLKGMLSTRFPVLSDVQKKPYWMLYGLDQFMHLSVVVMIWQIGITS